LASEARRLFLALWPDDGLRDALTALTNGLPEAAQGRRAAPDNLHITLVFLGPLNSARQHCVEEACAATRGHAFGLVLDTLGWFSRPQVLWLGASRIPAALQALVRDLNEGLAGCGHVPETREHRAHVTLARKVKRGPRQPQPVTPLRWQVDRFVLVESVPEPSGVRYEVLRSWRLAPGE
jgi:2'-5' RNA ligase